MAPVEQTTPSGAIPASVGIGLRTPHEERIARETPAIGWLEVHSENYFADGGMHIERLMTLRASYPLSLHGVGLSLGSTDPLDREHLRRLKRLVGWTEPGFVSEHLSWGSVGGIHLNDLLPLPYTEEALIHMIDRVGQLQDHLGRQILVENVSSYLRFVDSQMPEWEFLRALAAESGCGLLVDVNNVHVNACNHRFDAQQFISALDAAPVRELHLAGHSCNRHAGRDILIDTHATPVCAEVWSLYEFALDRYGRVPTLIEWDTDIPALDRLMVEADEAGRRMERAHALAA
jgi:uncharacterized protein (UPF0276 family)